MTILVFLDYYSYLTHNEANRNAFLWLAHDPHALLVVMDHPQNFYIVAPTAIKPNIQEAFGLF